MSIVLQGSTSGSVTLQEPAIAGTTVLTLPAVSGTILTTTSPKAGNVLQVVSATKSDTFSSSLTSWNDITGLSVSITPTSASSKILIIFNVFTGETTNQFPFIRIVRNSTVIGVGDAAGSRTQTTTASWSSGSTNVQNIQSMNFLDSPLTTSSTTYKLQTIATAGQSIFVNRNARDDNVSGEARGISTITVMEIAA